MTPSEAALRVLHYQPVDRLPIVHFGFWDETLIKWAEDGYLSLELAKSWGDGNPTDAIISKMLGFDFNWSSAFHPNNRMLPGFEQKIVKELPDGSRHVLSGAGVIVLDFPGVVSIQAEIEHLLKDRASWEKDFKWRHQWSEKRVTHRMVRVGDHMLRWDQGGLDFLRSGKRDFLYGLSAGSLIGYIRNVLGVEGLSYLQVDDEPLLDEIINTVAELCYQTTRYALESGVKFDFAHFWEDISFKNGPLVSPTFFRNKIGPHYRRITDLVGRHGIDIVSVDSDGNIDALVPIWLENGVNTMFPIEVGTWNASIQPWRQQYGKALLGVGGMNKVIFSRNRAAVDAEIDRLKPLVALGGYLPCPDHRIPPDAKWDLVKYYCQRMRETF